MFDAMKVAQEFRDNWGDIVDNFLSANPSVESLYRLDVMSAGGERPDFYEGLFYGMTLIAKGLAATMDGLASKDPMTYMTALAGLLGKISSDMVAMNANLSDGTTDPTRSSEFPFEEPF